MKVNENYLKELQELANKSRLGNAKKYAKYSHLKLTYSWFEHLAEKWLEELTGFLSTTTKDTHAYDKRKIKCIRYLIHFGITSKEEIMDQVPRCPYCGELYQLPNCIDNLKNAYILAGHCGSESCKNKYVYDQTSKSVQKKYGVDNVSRLDSIQKKKERTLMKKYGVKHPQQAGEIREKSISTLREKYGVDNISQVRDIKYKKAETFKKNYGVDNIFKRYDMMRNYWMEKLGVPNPVYLKEVLLKFTHGTAEARKVYIFNKYHIVLSDLEKEFVKKVYNLVYNYNLINKKMVHLMKVNDIYFLGLKEETVDKKDKAYVPDVFFEDVIVEIKSGHTSNKEISKLFELVKLYNEAENTHIKWIYILCKGQTFRGIIRFNLATKQLDICFTKVSYDYDIMKKMYVKKFKELFQYVKIDDVVINVYMNKNINEDNFIICDIAKKKNWLFKSDYPRLVYKDYQKELQ